MPSMVQWSQFLGHTAVLQEFIRGEEFTVANCIGFVCPDAASGLVMKLSDLVVGKFFGGKQCSQPDLALSASALCPLHQLCLPMCRSLTAFNTAWQVIQAICEFQTGESLFMSKVSLRPLHKSKESKGLRAPLEAALR